MVYSLYIGKGCLYYLPTKQPACELLVNKYFF
jgi:hypothetical protein